MFKRRSTAAWGARSGLSRPKQGE